MNNKKGFTIVEVTLSLILLLIISLFIAKRVIMIDKSSKEKSFESKLALATNAAIKYGTDIIDDLSSNCTNVTIGTLINMNYLDADDDKYKITNPITNESMNNIVICIKYEYGKVTAIENELYN